jgi:hypothetical protein
MSKKKKKPKDNRTLIERARDAHAQANGNSKPSKPKSTKKKKSGISGKKAEKKTAKAGRDEKGFFVKGNQAGKGHGRPSAATDERFLTQLKNELTPEKWGEAVKAQVGRACKGDSKAFESLAKYCMPTPEQRLKIENQQQLELRVAGIAPNQIDAMFVGKLLNKVQRQREKVTANGEGGG